MGQILALLLKAPEITQITSLSPGLNLSLSIPPRRCPSTTINTTLPPEINHTNPTSASEFSYPRSHERGYLTPAQSKALTHLYHYEGLPPIQAPKPAEQRAIAAMGLTEFVSAFAKQHGNQAHQLPEKPMTPVPLRMKAYANCQLAIVRGKPSSKSLRKKCCTTGDTCHGTGSGGKTSLDLIEPFSLYQIIIPSYFPVCCKYAS